MSAFIVDKRHIDVMVELAVSGPQRAAQYPGDGYYGPRWFAIEPESGWTLEDYSNLSRQARRENADDVGRMLLGECIASVQHRYNDEPIADLPGTIAQTATWDEAGVEAYRFEATGCAISAVEGLSAIDSYEYQSCEHPGWPMSEAKRFCDALRSSLIGCLDGYREAPWSWNEETLSERRTRVLVR